MITITIQIKELPNGNIAQALRSIPEKPTDKEIVFAGTICEFIKASHLCRKPLKSVEISLTDKEQPPPPYGHRHPTN